METIKVFVEQFKKEKGWISFKMDLNIMATWSKKPPIKERYGAG